jgi:hypothetical protein
MSTQAEILKKQIEDQQKTLQELLKQEKLSKRSEAIKNLSEFTDEEKIKIFDKFYKSALSVVNEAEEKGYTDEDTPGYMYEEFMCILARNDTQFWKYFNSLT